MHQESARIWFINAYILEVHAQKCLLLMAYDLKSVKVTDLHLAKIKLGLVFFQITSCNLLVGCAIILVDF